MVFYYQPPLNEENWPKGYTVNETHALNEKGEIEAYRPLNVVGSYAVFHSSKKGNEYRAGKAYHIYRPELIDAEGKRAWADLLIENDLLTIILPQEVIDIASYPLVVDPTFGYTGAGASVSACKNAIMGSIFLGAEGTATSMTVFIYSWNVYQANFKTAIYKDSDKGLIPNGATTERNLGPFWAQWETFVFAVNSTVSNVNYWLVGWASSDMDIGYDTGDEDQGTWDSQVYNGFPATLTPDGFNTRKHSIYTNYTVGGGNNPPNAPILTNPANSSRYDPSSQTAFNWTFSDPDGGDTQSAYEFELDDDSGFGSPEIDTGKQSSSNEYHIATLPSSINDYFWRVKTWDQDDAEGPWSSPCRYIIVDRLEIVSVAFSDNRIDVSGSSEARYVLRYDYDNVPFDSSKGTVTGYTWDTEFEWWDKAITGSSEVGTENYDENDIEFTDSTHGLTTIEDDPGADLITDRIAFLVGGFEITDGRINLDANGEWYSELKYEYDGTEVDDGAVSLNVGAMSWDAGQGRWEYLYSKGVVGEETRNITSVSGNTHGITTLNSTVLGDSETIIFDRIVAYWEDVDDPRVNVDSNVEWHVRAVLDYDNHPLVSGDTIGSSWGNLPWDPVNQWFEISHSESTVGDYTISLTTGTEATYDITLFSENITETQVVYDRQKLGLLGVNNSEPIVNEKVELYVISKSDFDNHTLQTGDTLILKDTLETQIPMSYNGTHWIVVLVESEPKAITIDNYHSINEITYGITVLDMNGMNVSITWGEIPNNPPNAPTLTLPLNETYYDPSDYAIFNWTFSDPDENDTQAFYRLVLDNETDFSDLKLDTGKVNSTQPTSNQTLPLYLDGYYWRVKVWDNHDSDGAWSSKRILYVENLTVYDILSNDDRQSLNANVEIKAIIKAVSDSSPITSGTFYLEDETLSHSGEGNWTRPETRSSVGTYKFENVTGAIDYIETISNDNKSVSVIFDEAYTVDLWANKLNFQINETATITAVVKLRYDNHTLQTGDTLKLKDTDGTVYTFTYEEEYWVCYHTEEISVTRNLNTYDSVLESTHGITFLNMNGKSLSLRWGDFVKQKKDKLMYIMIFQSFSLASIIPTVLGASMVFSAYMGDNSKLMKQGKDMFGICFSLSLGCYIISFLMRLSV